MSLFRANVARAHTHTPFADSRPLLGKRPHPGTAHIHGGPQKAQRAGRCVESAPREQGSLAPASPHPRHSLSERHNYLGSSLTMQIPRPPDVLYPNVRWGLRICIYELPQIIDNAHAGLASTVQPCPPSWRDWPSLPQPLGGP